ncbi:MAG: glycosyltransferase family 39 protein [Deltaproteobacteria bacterium]|nr:glycosyltransferase family 39 protein [Deltaproteobacteria bacterium]
MRSLTPAVEGGLVVALLAFLAVNALVVARGDTPTVDEFVYLPAGHYHLVTGDLTFDPTNPPLLKMVMALPLLAMDVRAERDPRWRDDRTGWGPWVYGTRFMEVNRARYFEAFFAGRVTTIVLALATGVLLWWWARRVATRRAAAIALFLWCVQPTVIAHGALATLDMGVTALVFAAFFALARLAATEARPWAAAAGALFGLGVAGKGVTLIFAPLVPVLLAVGWRGRDRERLLKRADGIVVLAVSAWVALLAVYRFSGFPLPAPVLEGIRFQARAGSAGEFPAFLNGGWSQTGWWYYFLEAFALKTPLATIALVLAGLVVAARRRARTDLWFALPPLLLLYVLSFHFGKNYGVRYLLPALPFLFVLAGRGADAMLGDRRATAALATLAVWQVGACVATAPHYLAYFNELAGGVEHHRRLLLDSNLDWGQDLGRLKTWLDGQGTNRAALAYFGHVDPGLYGLEWTLPPPTPTPGRYIVSANYLAGYAYVITYARDRMIGVRRGQWSWLDRVPPTARIGRSLLAFDVGADDVRRLAGEPAR